ncbi:unnamed protein product [Mytilus coruscus]|uniref:Uncharacterized protein n=1 Tax=Mytilus coruscus TaxID=42192 RepID=A0A6J8DJF7_MYTCO|nr:unnamed protein product [Mytilus coruscus]
MDVRRSQNTQSTVDNVPVSRTVTASNLSVAHGPVINIMADLNHQEPPFIPFRIQEETPQESPRRNEENILDSSRGISDPMAMTSEPGPSGLQNSSNNNLVRMSASMGYSGGWVQYDEQFRLRKALSPSSSLGVVDMELWLLCVSTPYVTPSFNTGLSNGSNQQLHGGNSSISMISGALSQI